MVSNKKIKDLDFQTIEDYYNYILESEINGNRSQVINLIQELSKPQKQGFLNWLKDYFGSDVEIVKELTLNAF